MNSKMRPENTEDSFGLHLCTTFLIVGDSKQNKYKYVVKKSLGPASPCSYCQFILLSLKKLLTVYLQYFNFLTFHFFILYNLACFLNNQILSMLLTL